MNVKLITKALHILSLLSEEDVTTVMNLRALSEDERMLLITVLEPEKPTAKKPGKKASSKSSSKSPRAQSLSGAIQRAGKGRADDSDGDDPSTLPQYCLAMVEDNGGEIACGKTVDDNIHHLTKHPDYHEFTTGKSPAPLAATKSSTNGGAMSGTANSATETEDASSVHRAGG